MRIILTLILLFLSFTKIYSQNIYKDYNLTDTIKGERLTLGTNSVGYSHSSEYGNTLNLNLNAMYSKWKYTPSLLYYIQTTLYTNYNRSNYYDGTIVERNGNLNRSYSYENTNFIYVAASASYYFKPKKFYLSAAYSAELRNINSNYSDNSQSYSNSHGQGFLWTGIGYGRIENAEGLEQALTASESLLNYKVISAKLSPATLKEIDKKLYQFRNANYRSNYIDDASIVLMKDIEAILLNNREISQPLNAESSVRLYQVLMNSSERFYYYPRYIGSQINLVVQTHTFSHEKPKENFLTIAGVYGWPVSEKTNILFSAAFKHKLNVNAGNYSYQLPAYYSFYGYVPDYFNTQFDTRVSGLGVFAESYGYLDYHNSQISAKVISTYSLSSTAGLNLGAEYYFYPANSETDNFEYYYSNRLVNEYRFRIAGQLDYNIYSRLFSHFRAGFGQDNYRNSFSIGVDFEYVVF